MKNRIEYEILVQNALRNVIRDILANVAENGLPGEHHFYISFATRAPGVRISARLLARFPESMTIVLQHRFWDMSVSAEFFTVRLSFGGIAEKLIVPFSAMQGFYDPSAAFEIAFSAGGAPQEKQDGQGESIVAFPPQAGAGETASNSQADSAIMRNPPFPPKVPPQYAKPLPEPDSAAKNAAADTAENSADAANGQKPREPQQQAEKPRGALASIVSLDAFRKK